MSIVCRDISELKNKENIKSFGERYGISFSNEFIDFFSENNGGIPFKKEILVDDEEYEVRCFLSFHESDYNNIFKPTDFFQKQTKGKIFPIAKDSGDNYFCMNVDNNNIYYWDKEENKYYLLKESFNEFIVLFCSKDERE